jgi:hypothetical protein
MSRPERTAMQNPFSFSGVVDDPSFCNREKEQTELVRLIQSSRTCCFIPTGDSVKLP